MAEPVAKKQKTEEEAPKPGTAEEGMNATKEGWFTELSTMWPGQGLSLKVKEVLHQGRSDFQDVCVFETDSIYGRVLTLDGVIQITTYDEFSYQEMLTHLPTCSLRAPPKKALVVGGGDGGVLRELARHTCLEEIHIAEIDGMVPEMAKKYFPQMAVGFDDPRVTVNICDGIKFVQDAEENTYDVIIVDSSDPVGPAEVLFERPFFEAMHRALKPGGMVATQAESLWLHMPIIKSLAGMCKDVFKGGSVSYAYTTIPTYPSGQIGFMLCSKKCDAGPVNPRAPIQSVPAPAEGSKFGPLKYYHKLMHSAAFILPQFALDELSGSLFFQ